jgi:hypothetical protein
MTRSERRATRLATAVSIVCVVYRIHVSFVSCLNVSDASSHRRGGG